MSTGFDPDLKLVSSHILRPILLAIIRLLIAFFILATLIYLLVWEAVVLHEANSFFSYFTNLTFIGLCAYFFASGVQTFFYASNARKEHNRYPLQNWPGFIQYLHVLLLSTVLTFPILVTIVYWALLASSESFSTTFNAYSNISKHALNSVFALFEILFTNVGPMPWKDLPVTIIMLGGYLGVAYITHVTQGFYTYSFLDPQKEGKTLAAYIVGIAVGQIVIFLIVYGIVSLRQALTHPRHQEPSPTAEKRTHFEQA
ncbi:hypothetical protein CPB83DRAFT_861156 [Crepidotus variabilis]|uniref:Uncharacterized protein n=1 Tax=Crepidotus variabilis TaxID=179855 RepID=A0A9P6E8E3_9AGAR|nr:hypothetical protein CPB83DRAFT_861156 [Crepidotus variabilis]